VKTILTFLTILVTVMLDAVISASLRFLPCAFDPAQMNRQQVGTMTAWYYRSDADAIAVVEASGYFDSHAELMALGDVIIVSDTNLGLINTLGVTSVSRAVPVTTLVAVT